MGISNLFAKLGFTAVPAAAAEQKPVAAPVDFKPVDHWQAAKADPDIVGEHVIVPERPYKGGRPARHFG